SRIIFFFPSSLPHPPLSSFPTRRSSDLPGLLLSVAWNDLFLDHGNCLQFLLKMKIPGRASEWRYFAIATDSPSGCSQRVSRWQSDRKSSRLNSSHVAISYAVFCLKKKKQ